ncbi:MAG: deoxyribonuclease V [Gammaproteobacteria bacterium]|nr:deoxyribonuclease V [Gammaproteobacteria bacterium]
MSNVDHPWNVTPRQAVEIQQSLRGLIEREDRLGPVRRIAGVDVGFEDEGRTTRAAVAVLDARSLELVDCAIARRPTRFPYVPGLLSFREIPAILDALARLRTAPDLLLCDGQGIAHPRRLGIASHLGLVVGLPSIGVGKTRLCGTHGRVPERKGAWTPLRDGEEIIGAVLRTRAGVKPLYVSIGHRIGLDTAIEQVLRATTRYRLPETTRWAHRLASGPAAAGA